MKKKRGKSQKKIAPKEHFLTTTEIDENEEFASFTEACKAGPEAIADFFNNGKRSFKFEKKQFDGVFFYSVSRKDGKPICMGSTYSKKVVFLDTYSHVANIAGPNYTGQNIENLNIEKVFGVKPGTYIDCSYGYDGRYIKQSKK